MRRHKGLNLSASFWMLLTVVAAGATGFAQERVLVDIENIQPKENKVQAFRLNAQTEISIEAIGFRSGRHGEFGFSRAWILDANNREVVWNLEEAESHRKGRKLTEYEDSITLPGGVYEVYYSSFPFYYPKKEGIGNIIGRWFSDIFDDGNYEYDHYRKDWRQFKIVVRGQGETLSESELRAVRQEIRDKALVSFVEVEDNEQRQQGFILQKPLKLYLYVLGEARKDGTFDYGWIVDVDRHKKVWKFSLRGSDYAGGAKKNRMVRETLSLPAGKYVAYYVSDDSHAYGSWNAAPPFDPEFWGMSIFVGNPAERSFARTFDYDDIMEKNAIVKMVRVRNNEYRSQGFTCKRDLTVRIYALGEGYQHQMFDYAWIVDARSHRKIWEMEYQNTEHAGGGKKNRLYDGELALKKGDYIVYYVSDDSHSYWDWNVAPPYDKEKWGITIYAADANFSPKDVVLFDENDERNVLAQLIKVRDNEREHKRFTLDQDQDVRIYALGEGSKGDMYDYGWIEDAQTGEVVWEMTYSQTEAAGGSYKNRLVDKVISLKKGEYALYYESDDSHSYEAWNAAPPYDPNHWGITVYRAQN